MLLSRSAQQHRTNHKGGRGKRLVPTFEVLRTLALLAWLTYDLYRLARERTENMFFHPITMLGRDAYLDQGLNALFTLINITDIQLLAYTSANSCRVRLLGRRLLRMGRMR